MKMFGRTCLECWALCYVWAWQGRGSCFWCWTFEGAVFSIIINQSRSSWIELSLKNEALIITHNCVQYEDEPLFTRSELAEVPWKRTIETIKNTKTQSGFVWPVCLLAPKVKPVICTHKKERDKERDHCTDRYDRRREISKTNVKRQKVAPVNTQLSCWEEISTNLCHFSAEKN